MTLSFMSSVAASPRYGAVSPPPPPPPVSGDPYFYNVPGLWFFEDATTWAQNYGYLGGPDITPNFGFEFTQSEGPFSNYGSLRNTLSSGSSRYGTLPHNDYYTNFVGAFTIECWAYIVSQPTGQRGLISKYTVSGSQRGWALIIQDNRLRCLYTDEGGNFAGMWDTDDVPFDQWSHFCLERNNDNLVRLYLNGSVVDSDTYSGTIFNNTGSPLYFGGYNEGSDLNTGDRLGMCRITRDMARYDGAFTVPSAPFKGEPLTSELLLPSFDATLQYHFAADEGVYSDTSETNAVNNDTVAEWLNNGTKENAQQTTALNRPVFKTNGLNAKPYINFNGTDQFFEDILFTNVSGGFAFDPFTLVVVTDNITGLSDFPAILGNASFATKNAVYFRDTVDEQIHAAKPGFRANNVVNPQVLALQCGRQSDTVSLPEYRQSRFQNDVYVFSDTDTAQVDSNEVTQTQFFRYTNVATGGYFNGDVYEVFIFRPTITRSQATQLSRYLMIKYGITLG